MTEDDVKRSFIERQKRLFHNILRQLENGLAKGVTDEWLVNDFKRRYREIVYDDAKKAYTDYKLKTIKKKERDYEQDLFSSKI